MPTSLISDQRLARQIAFIVEIDRLKLVLRRTLIGDGSRHENSAEHSWTLAMLALLLSEYAAEPVDSAHVMKMVLVHDIVEIDAGDTFFYDDVGTQDKAEREQLAAARLFGLLPDDQAAELRGLWEEFEARQTPEARFAAAIDRLMPLIHNYLNDGYSWRRNHIRPDQVRQRNNRIIAAGSPALGDLAEAIVAEGQANGYFDPPDAGGGA